MGRFSDGLPPPDLLCSMEPEELALPLLEILCQLEDAEEDNHVHLGNYLGALRQWDKYEHGREDAVARAITESWHWLEFRGLLAQRPDQGGAFKYVTRRGRRLRAEREPKKYLARNLLDDIDLSPGLIDEVRGPFLRLELDKAVRDAFRFVEVRVRTLAQLGPDVTGSKSPMTEAFRPDPPGRLVDPTQPKGEREGTYQLFLGAMARFRNPGMHGDIGLDDPREALELIAFANVLIRLAERGTKGAEPSP